MNIKNKTKINWTNVKSKLEEEYENITGDDFTFADSENENDTFAQNNPSTTGKSRTEAERKISKSNTTK